MEFLYLVLVFAVVILCVKNSQQKNEIFEKEMDIEKEKLKKKLKKHGFYELIEMRDSYKAACKSIKMNTSKLYNNIEFQKNYALYKACKELAREKYKEEEHGPWFDYYDDGEI